MTSEDHVLRDLGLYVDTTGIAWPVVEWLDADAQPCVPTDAIVCIAGAGGCWFSIDLSLVRDPTRH